MSPEGVCYLSYSESRDAKVRGEASALASWKRRGLPPYCGDAVLLYDNQPYLYIFCEVSAFYRLFLKGPEVYPLFQYFNQRI